jgi:hypothetical protein
MFQTSRTTKRLLSSCAGVLLALAGTAFAQDSATQQSTTSIELPPPGTTTIELPRAQDYEVGVFGGADFFKRKNDALQTDLQRSSAISVTLTENFANHFGTEQSFGYAQNALQFLPDFNGTLVQLNLAQKLWQFQDSLLYYFSGKRSSVRPYVKAGFGIISYRPDSSAINLVTAPNNADLGAQNLRSDTELAFNFGGGLKVRFTDHFGIKSELVGILSRQPHYGLSEDGGTPPQLNIPNGGVMWGIQLSSGLYFAWGGKETITLPIAHAWSGVSIAASGNNICPGPAITVKATVNNMQGFAKPNYRWMVDGHDAGTNSDTITVPSDNAGTHQVGLTVVDSVTLAKSTVPPITLTINAHTPPTITANADKTDLQLGETAKLFPHPQAGSCPGNLTVMWAVSEGTVAGSDPATYDSSSVQFDASNPGSQTKQITATATVTDDKGGSASAPVTLTVSKKGPEYVRQDDLIFPTSNSRVNNCDKRILIDQVYPALTSGQYSSYDVVLVGHAGNEPPEHVMKHHGRHAPPPPAVDLAMERARHAAEILASGDGICPKPGIDVSRIKIATVGPSQGAEFRKPICAASIKERKASMITSSDDQLKDQRVEIWFVPKGSNLPASAANAQQAPDTVKSECPK